VFLFPAVLLAPGRRYVVGIGQDMRPFARPIAMSLYQEGSVGSRRVVLAHVGRLSTSGNGQA
jgi:hypothetical protein